MDECQKDPKLCSNGICRNTPGSFECICGDGYVLAKGTTACVGKSNVFTLQISCGQQQAASFSLGRFVISPRKNIY